MKINKIFIFFLIYASCLFKKSTAPIQLEFFLDSMTPDEFGISMMCILKITDPHYILVDYYITNDGNTSIAVPNNSLTMPSVYFDSKNNTRYIQNISSEFWNPPEIIIDELLIIIHPRETKIVKSIFQLWNKNKKVINAHSYQDLSQITYLACRTGYWPWYNQSFSYLFKLNQITSEKIKFRALPVSEI